MVTVDLLNYALWFRSRNDSLDHHFHSFYSTRPNTQIEFNYKRWEYTYGWQIVMSGKDNFAD